MLRRIKDRVKSLIELSYMLVYSAVWGLMKRIRGRMEGA